MRLRPATFAEAGVAAPFTTPAIAQARLRLDRRGRTEVVVRNPTGNTGAYVMPLEALCELFRLSIHDRALLERLETIQPISPLTIRDAARTLALEGLAGPDAQAAAERSVQEDEEHALLSLLLLLERLLAEAGQPRIDWKSIDPGDRAVRDRLKPYFKRLEPSTGMAGAELVGAVDALSAVVAPVGFAQAPFKSLSVATLADLRALRESIESWARAERDEIAAIVGLILTCATLTITCAEKSLADAHTLVESVGRLLHAHGAAPATVAERLGRPVWLLYGWRHLGALWQAVADQPREVQRDVIVELGELVPLVPLSADSWLGETGPKPRSQYEIHRQVRLMEDWRTGHIIERQAMLEQLHGAAF